MKIRYAYLFSESFDEMNVQFIEVTYDEAEVVVVVVVVVEAWRLELTRRSP